MEETDIKNIEQIIVSSIERKEELSSKNFFLAEKIGYKNLSGKISITDCYGFEKKIDNQMTLLERGKLMKISNARMEKWLEIIENFDKYYENNFSKLKSRARKGIPDCLRGISWIYLAGVENHISENSSVYEKLSKIVEGENDSEDEIVILRDVNRTFPEHVFFNEKYGPGQRSLFRVLKAYSKFNTKTGYVQGMGFLTALFLSYTNEESAFWLLHSLMNDFGLEGFYLPNFPELPKSFYKFANLMVIFLPNIHHHFIDKKRSIFPSMYCSQWFITLFSVNFDFDILVRIMDVYLVEGDKVIYRIGLAILKIIEEKLLSEKHLEGVMKVLQNCFEHIEIELLFKVAFGFGITRKQLKVNVEVK